MEEKFYKEAIDSLKNVFDITSRIDERVKVLVENHNEAKDKIEKLGDSQAMILNRLAILENSNSKRTTVELKDELNKVQHKVDDIAERLFHVEKDFTQVSNKWATTLDFIFKVGVIVIGGIILWKLGLKP